MECEDSNSERLTTQNARPGLCPGRRWVWGSNELVPPNGKIQTIYVKKQSPNQDARVSLDVSGQTKTLYLLADLLEPRRSIVALKDIIGISSGGSDKQDEWCQRRTASACFHPDKPDAYLEAGSGHLAEESRVASSNAGWTVTRDTPEEICLEVWANTGDCRISVSIRGRPEATERYLVSGPTATATTAISPAESQAKVKPPQMSRKP